MSYCPKCGAYIPDGDTKCVACGYDTAPQKKEEPKKEKKNSAYSYDYKGGGAAAQQAPPEQEKRRYEAPPKQDYSYRYQPSQQDTGPYAKNENDYARTEYRNYSAPDLGTGTASGKRLLAILSYIGPLFLIPLITKKDDPELRFHANQGMVLFLAEILVDLCAAVPVIGWLVAAVGGVMVFIAFLNGISNAANGRLKPLPFFGNIQLFK